MKRPEILAPAGSLPVALAAFDAGADAVYAGMKKFNARERGDNFSSDEMARLIAYAHGIHKKVYVTFNTLVKESEIEDVASALAELNRIRPDALIVQDLGVVRMIRYYFPNLTIHASTQMALHDSEALAVAAEMGISRVILERQITLEEIRRMVLPPGLELEVFIHGALCCCLSGICLFSSWMGGFSGNRGKCKQPCRRLFRGDGSGKEAFYLSTRDLAAESLIPELTELGVASFKIEGRLRKADYVSRVVKMCRGLVDGTGDDIPDAEESSEPCSRELSLGFYTAESAKKLIRSEAPGGIGMVCGRIRNVLSGSFDVDLSSRIHVGDKLRVQSPRGGEARAMTLLDMTVNGRRVLKAFPGQRCRIASPGRDIAEDGIVYKIGETHDAMTKRCAALPPWKPSLDVRLLLTKNGLDAECLDRVWHCDLNLADAANCPVDPAALAEAFSVTGNAPLSAGTITARVEGSFFLPLGQRKELRKQFWAWAADVFPEHFFRLESERCRARLLADHENFSRRRIPFEPSTTEYPEALDNNQECLLPFFTPEDRLDELKNRIADAYWKKGVRMFRATSLAHFRMLRPYPGIVIRTFAPLPICNSFAVAEIASLGASGYQAHLELGKEDLNLLRDFSVLPPELLIYGRPILLATRASLGETIRLSTQTERFQVKKEDVLTVLIPETPLRIPALPGFHLLIDKRNSPASTGEPLPGAFNFDRGLA